MPKFSYVLRTVSWLKSFVWPPMIMVYNIWMAYSNPAATSIVHANVLSELISDFDLYLRISSDSYSRISETFTNLSQLYIYTEELPCEKPMEIPENKPNASWPDKGIIEFIDYSMKYRPDLPQVLKKLSFATKANEKIGIVGCTGAGKSSLTYVLMRMVEAEDGKLVIDGIDVSTIGLNDLRSSISIIPQDPVLFEGTICDNLDPAGKYTDDEVWDSINGAKIANLLDKPTRSFVDDPNDLDAVGGPWIEGVGLNKWVDANGINFSVGQRQLLSICRALLWKSKIVVLDEATANVDSAADKVMQDVIREAFKDCTVLTIAHCLNTIMDSDRVLVIDQGQVAEFDIPECLLANKDSHFTKLVESMKLNHSQLL